MNLLRWYRKPYTDQGWAIFCIRRNFLARLFRSRSPGYVRSDAH